MSNPDLNRFAFVLQKILHPDFLVWDKELQGQLESIDPSSVKEVRSDNHLHIRSGDLYFPVPVNSFTDHQFITVMMGRLNTGYVGACAAIKELIDTQYYEEVYGRVVFCLHDGTEREAFYFLGTARRKRA